MGRASERLAHVACYTYLQVRLLVTTTAAVVCFEVHICIYIPGTAKCFIVSRSFVSPTPENKTIIRPSPEIQF